MRRGRSTRHHPSRDLGLLAPVFVSLAALQPSLSCGGLPQGYDTLFHLHRLVQLDALVRQGILYSRWSPYLARGFGYPLFSYYGPLSYYLAEALHLVGLSSASALGLTFALAVVAGAIGMYLWARDLLGTRAGLLAAAAYVLTPSLVTNATVRMGFAEQVAMGLLPWVFLCLRRLLFMERARYTAATALLLAGVIVTHNATALLVMPFLVGYIILLTTVSTRGYAGAAPEGQRRGTGACLAWTCAAMMLALALSAFYWLPVLVERELVQIDRLTAWAVFDYRHNLLGLGELFPPPRVEDHHLLNPINPVGLNAFAALYATIGVATGWRRLSPIQKLHAAFAILAASVGIAMAHRISAPLWAVLRPLHILQFPWRFLGIANLFLALAAGASVTAIEGNARTGGHRTSAIAAVMVCTMLAWVAPWQRASQSIPLAGSLTVDDIVRYEHETTYIGTTTTGEYLPASVLEYPPPEGNPHLYVADRLNRDALPDGVQVLAAEYQPLAYDLTIEAPRPFSAVFDTFYFPGWRAWVDGVEVGMAAIPPHGVIGVPVPAGKHTIRVAFGSTPVRTWSGLASLIAAMGLAVSAAFRGVCRRRIGARLGAQANDGAERRCPSDPEEGAAPVGHRHPTGTTTLALCAAMVAFIGIKAYWVDPVWASYRRTAFDLATSADFSGQLLLLGADGPTGARSGEEAHLSLYWRVPAETEVEYSTSVHLIDGQGHLCTQSDNRHPGGISTAGWEPERYVRDSHAIPIPSGTPPGRYALHVAVYPVDQPWSALDVLDSSGAPLGRHVEVGTLEIARPRRRPDVSEVATSAPLGPHRQGLGLVGYDVAKTTVSAGESVLLTLLWHTTESLGAGLTAQLKLLDADGRVVHAVSVPPVAGYDTQHWRPGDVWRGVHELTIPAHLSGLYHLGVGLSAQEEVRLAQISVTAPEHVYDEPATARAASARFGELASLVGFDVQGEAVRGGTIVVTLVWRVEGQTQEPYKTFVHLLDGAGLIVAGSDCVADEWRRPSPGWVTGEYIVDRHYLQIPEDADTQGPFHLEIGIYHAITQGRLSVDGSADALVLPLVVASAP